jgi:hypothetical protein
MRYVVRTQGSLLGYWWSKSKYQFPLSRASSFREDVGRTLGAKVKRGRPKGHIGPTEVSPVDKMKSLDLSVDWISAYKKLLGSP